MERTRRIVNFIFWVITVILSIGLLIAFVGGAFPININPAEQNAKFDVASFGWELGDPPNGTLAITHVSGNYKGGFGGMEYTYKNKGRGKAGFKSTAYPIEGLTYIEFWAKAKNPCVWQLQIKRKSDSRLYHKTFEVGTSWQKYSIYLSSFKNETAPGVPFQAADIQTWMYWVDMGGRYKDNVLYIDEMHIVR